MIQTSAPCMKCEFVIVIGAEDLYSGKSRHNKMMFAQNAVRYTKRWGSQFDRTTVFMFNGTCSTSFDAVEDGKVIGTYFEDGYTTAQIAATKNSIENYGGIFKAVKRWANVADHLNNTADKIDGCEKRVQVLIFFCHGTPGKIWLANTRREFLTSANIGLVSVAAFLPEAALPRRYLIRHVTSWACQSANGSLPDATFEESVANSLAQKMADAWDIEVRASATRTLYSSTFSTGIAGRIEDVFGDRRMIDGCLWEDDGSDGSVRSGPNGSHEHLIQGMWEIGPGQRSDYQRLSLD